jgi:hypothetical protein
LAVVAFVSRSHRVMFIIVLNHGAVALNLALRLILPFCFVSEHVDSHQHHQKVYVWTSGRRARTIASPQENAVDLVIGRLVNERVV